MASSRIKAVFGIAGVVFLSKILGLLREMVIADRFGTSADYDLYLIAIILPALAYGVVNFASFYLFVPYLTRAFERRENGPDVSGWKAAWPLLNVSLLAALAITVAMILGAPWLMKVWAGGFSPEQYETIVFYSRLTALMVVLGTSEAFLRAVLNVKKIFTYPAAGPIIFNLLSILCIAALAGKISVGAIAVGLLTGLLAQNIYLLFRLIRLKTGKTYRFTFDTGRMKALTATAGVLLLIELMNRSYFMIDRYFAPRFGEGIIAALNYSQVLVQLPDAVVGFAIASVLFPLFSRTADESDRARFNELYRKAIVAGMLTAAPLAVLFYADAAQIVHLIFYRGVFDFDSLEKTARVLRPYTPTIAALFIISTSVRACYGRGWARSVLWFTVLLLASKFAATALLPRWFGYPGISAATSLSQVGFALLLLALVVRRSRMEAWGRLAGQLVKIAAAGAVGLAGVLVFERMAGAALFEGFSRPTALLKIVLDGVVLAIIYGLLVYFMGFGEYIKNILRMKNADAD